MRFCAEQCCLCSGLYVAWFRPIRLTKVSDPATHLSPFTPAGLYRCGQALGCKDEDAPCSTLAGVSLHHQFPSSSRHMAIPPCHAEEGGVLGQAAADGAARAPQLIVNREP